MKAAIVERYGPPDVVHIGDAPKPVPAPDQVLVRVHATTVNRTDCGELRPHPLLLGRLLYGLFRPKRRIFGLDFAGVVETVGTNVASFKIGDRVFGMCPSRSDGAHADYVCVRESGAIAPMPPDRPFGEAVVCEGAFYADAGLSKFGVGKGHRILVYGASGAIGSAAVQLAKASGAHVTAVVATRHIEIIRSLGPDDVVDYTEDDLSQFPDKFDFVFEAVGKESYFRFRPLLKPQGVFLATDLGPRGENLPLMLWSMITGNNRVLVPLPYRHSGQAFVRKMKALMESGKFRALVDRTYPFGSIAEAYRYVETGQKTGIVVIDMLADATTPASEA